MPLSPEDQHDHIERIAEQTVRTLQTRWAAVKRDLMARVTTLTEQIDAAHAAGEQVSPLWLYQRNRMAALLDAMRTATNDYAQVARAMIGAAQADAATLGHVQAQEALDATVPPGVHYLWGVVPPQTLSQLATALNANSALAGLFDGFGAQVSEAAKQALFSGLALGDNPRTIGAALAAILDGPSQRGAVIARTEVLRAWRHAQLATYQANSDVVQQWCWRCAFGLRTCGACLAMDGTMHSLDESLDDHICGRCHAEPITRSWADILGMDSADLDLPDDPSESLQLTGAEWFDQQDQATQIAILGPAKQAAYAAGDLRLSDLVGVSSDPQWGTSIREKSLKELGLSASTYRNKGA